MRRSFVAFVLLVGCAVVRPVSMTPPLPTPPPPAYVLEVAPPGQVAAPQGTPARAAPERPQPPLGPWWTAFGDDALDALVDEAHRHNFTLRDLRGLYHEDLLAPGMPNGPLWPLQIGLPVSVQRQNVGVAAIGNPAAPSVPGYSTAFNEADVGIAATYQLDLWGQLDMQRKDILDQAEIQAQSAEAGAQNVAVQVANLWFDILEQRELLTLIERQVKLNEDLQALVKDRFELHLTTRLAVLQQEQQLLNLRAAVPIIKARLALLGSQMTGVLGRPPSPDTTLVPEDRRLPELPSMSGVGTPADLVKNSPEVRLAQVRVAEAEHRVSQNLSGWLPVVSLFGAAGVQAFDLTDPLDLNTRTLDNGKKGHNSYNNWSIGARLTWPIFDGGQRITEAKQLTLTVERRNMLYEEAFYTAVRRVQDAQIQEQRQAANVKTLRAEVALGQQVLDEAKQLYEQGLSDYLAVLTAFGNLADLERGLLLSERLLLSYRIELYRALGGTWSRPIAEMVH
ncbi:MAG TPA: TolC family protein [Myxococcales bacterium]|jgi:outer membrane protein TolC